MFKNRIRLPFYVTRPQFPTESTTFRLANGTRKTLSAIVRKVFEGETDNMPRELHERLVIALKHDDVTIEGKYYLGGVSLDGDYDIDWNKFLDFPLAKAAFKVDVTPFDYSNNNCQTCEDLSQVVCVDDNIGTIDEDDTVTVHPLANDAICCSPVTISLVTYNSDYLDSCIISGTDIIIHTKASLPLANSINLVTYRAECPNGAYDEANIIADINGSEPACLAPTSPALVSLDSDTSATFSWAAPDPIPDCGYHWEVQRSVTGEVLASGDTSSLSVSVTGLPSNEQDLNFFVRSNCCDGFNSNYAGPVIFSLPPPSGTESCGAYLLNNFSEGIKHASYIDCTGVEQFVSLTAHNYTGICALQSSPGNPVNLVAQSGITVTYLGLC